MKAKSLRAATGLYMLFPPAADHKTSKERKLRESSWEEGGWKKAVVE